MRELIVTVALQVGLLVAVHAQELPCRWNQAIGTTIPNGIVADIGVLGDLDGDGVSDLVVGIKPDDFFAPPHSDGFVELRSGADGTLIRTILLPPFGIELRDGGARHRRSRRCG